MRQAGNYWFPDNDTHFTGDLYQAKKLGKALKYLKKRDNFLDIGAHCGTWSYNAFLAKFKAVYAVEPLEEHIQCYKKTLEGKNYVIIKGAAGNDEIVKINRHPTNTGATTFEIGNEVNEEFHKVIKVDDIKLPRIDLMKIDVQGFELPVVQGARCTISDDRPVIIIEQSDNNDAVEYLKKMGYKKAERHGRDYIMVYE